MRNKKNFDRPNNSLTDPSSRIPAHQSACVDFITKSCSSAKMTKQYLIYSSQIVKFIIEMISIKKINIKL